MTHTLSKFGSRQLWTGELADDTAGGNIMGALLDSMQWWEEIRVLESNSTLTPTTVQRTRLQTLYDQPFEEYGECDECGQPVPNDYGIWEGQRTRYREILDR